MEHASACWSHWSLSFYFRDCFHAQRLLSMRFAETFRGDLQAIRDLNRSSMTFACERTRSQQPDALTPQPISDTVDTSMAMEKDERFGATCRVRVLSQYERCPRSLRLSFSSKNIGLYCIYCRLIYEMVATCSPVKSKTRSSANERSRTAPKVGPLSEAPMVSRFI